MVDILGVEIIYANYPTNPPHAVNEMLIKSFKTSSRKNLIKL
jgi:hypothetical protein